MMDPTNANTALASAFTDEMVRLGIRHAVISPGSRSTPLAVALWRDESIETSVIVDERSAGFFALGAAQSSGVPAALLCTSGTAAANYLPAICEADESGIPLLILTADRPPELRGIGAGQTIDQIGMYGSAVRWFCEVGTHLADDSGLLHLRSVACRAYAASVVDGRPGPVHLNFALREPLAPISQPGAVTATDPLALDGRGARPLSGVVSPPRHPDSDLLDRLAEQVRASPNGLILAGRQTDPAIREPLTGLARATGYPVLAEPTSQLRLGPHDRGLVISHYEAIARTGPDSLRPELIIRFGDLPTSRPLRQWLGEPGAPEQILIDPGGGWNDPIGRVGQLLRSDAPATAKGLLGRLAEYPPAEDWPDLWCGADAAIGEALDSALEAEAISEPSLHRALGRSYQEGDLIYTASSMPIRDQEAFLGSSSTDVLFLANRGANGIDGLISSGIGAAHQTGRPTVIITGDLGLLHDLGSLAALRDITTPVRIIVINNDGGGIFHMLPQARAMGADEFEALQGTGRNVDVARAAALFDLGHIHLEDIADLPDALAAGTGLIEIRTDRRARPELNQRLAAAAASVLDQI